MNFHEPKLWFAFAGILTLFGVVGFFLQTPLIARPHFVPAPALAAIGLILRRQGGER